VIKKLKFENKLVCSLLICSISALLGSGLAQAQVKWLDRTIVIVENDVILQSEFDARLKSVEEKIKNRPKNTSRPPQEMVSKEVIDMLILESIQLQMAERRGIRIEDDELNKSLEGIARQNQMTLPAFKLAIQQEGLSYLDAREQIRNEMLLSRVQQWTLRNQIAVSDQEVDSYLNSDAGQKSLSIEYRVDHLLLVAPTSASPETLEQVEQEAKNISAEFKQGVSFTAVSNDAVRGAYALRTTDLGWRKTLEIPSLFAKQVPDMKAGEVIGPIQSPSGFHFIRLAEKRGAAVHMVDEVLVRHILIPPNEVRTQEQSQKIAMELYQRIKKGEGFTELAKQFSEDPGSAQDGGKLAWAGYDKYVPEFSAVAKRLAPGEMSEPFTTQFGWHILQVLERRNEDRSIEFQRDQIRRLIFNRKFEEEKNNWLRKIREEAFVEILEKKA